MSKNKWWPHLRTVFISLHLLAVCLKSIPAPEGGMNKKDWKNPTVQAELTTWTNNLSGLGFEVTTSELEGLLWNLAKKYMKIRRGILKPFKLYYQHVGSDQNWRLFVAPHMYPSKLHIDMFIEDKWVPVYQPFTDYRWNEQLIETSRFRPTIFRYSWSRYKVHYRKMGVFFAKKAAKDFPEATNMRTRWWQQKSASPEQIITNTKPEGKWRLIYHFSLEEYR
jgi:hypothetical protein